MSYLKSSHENMHHSHRTLQQSDHSADSYRYKYAICYTYKAHGHIFRVGENPFPAVVVSAAWRGGHVFPKQYREFFQGMAPLTS